jgi:hypothetical protein
VRIGDGVGTVLAPMSQFDYIFVGEIFLANGVYLR